MVVVCHQNNKVVKVCKDGEVISFETSLNIASTLMILAKNFPTDRIIWSHINIESNINWDALDEIFHHDRIMVSFNKDVEEYFSNGIGYIDESAFLNINKKVSYPTWLTSSAVGGISSKALLQFENKIKLGNNFDYFLHSIAKIASMKGLFCYSEPRLIIDKTISIPVKRANVYTLFQFVKQHYRTRWIFILFLNFLIFEKRFPIAPLLFSLRFKKRNKINFELAEISVKSKLKIMESKTIDVIIPTIGRRDCLYDVLQDLAKQTHLPQNVIIVEQNPIEGSLSELNYLTSEKWPFAIKHIFTHQTGACNARNVALSQVSSEWVFLNDDDNRFDENLIGNIFNKIEQFGIFVATTSYLQKNEELLFKDIHQTGIFGSGNSFIKSSCLANVSFSMSLEFGYGEDFDFGMQLRQQGFDVIYFPDPAILHLKAPFGGFRIKPHFPWTDEKCQPKPSPTIMYTKQKYLNQKQIYGYKLRLFIKSIRKESIFNWADFYVSFKKGWNLSVDWSKKI
ncbi:glycosyltransferase family 2 protein [Flavobacterium nitrogenifigens]|uniref:Glycosyltransferase, GT2 family n=1 Tax=Flavobacterium nitrogenifigens TaxID=1617283 RepID=A0A521EE53_9FLAO|nr:glycosyltransferase family A protein [Flavobacterium nitrogenifigens]KAF2325960.1 glycosyltransferase family 2 protein [Flavobacterium nitrogenifigens]SMO82199.1 Glycosyltransferase, GT2 family [Flavobacterium nitrogenifigens]